MEAQLSMVVVEGRVELVRSMDPTTIDDHHHLFLGFAEGRHDLMEIVAQFRGVQMSDNFVEDFGGTIRDRGNDTEQHPAGDPTPGAIADPRLAFEALVAFDLTGAQWPGGQASTLGFAPPARPGEGKTPEDGFIFIAQNDLPLTSSILESRECERAVGEISRGRIKTPRGTAVVYGFFFSTSRTLSRLSW